MQSLTQNFINIRKKILENRFKNLNNMQKKAVFNVNGPVLILAGAGSGKTTVLINRIVNMIKYGNAYYSNEIKTLVDESDFPLLERAAEDYFSLSDEQKENVDMLIADEPVKPYNILAITFTNKAANEIKERLTVALGEKGNDVNSGTFHSICVRILRRDIEKIGYQKNFTIYDTDDSKRVIKDVLKELNLDEKMFPVKTMLNEISRAKDKLLTPEKFIAEGIGDYYKESVSRIYTAYQSKLKNANALDFDDIIMLTVRLFEKSEESLNYFRNRYKYIMVDEYQDTNKSQYRLVSLLSGGHKNLCVVGDDDQSIYRFRGATIENILNFEFQFENSVVIRLEQNYRSTQNILDAANSIIKNNGERKQKSLWTDAGSGDKVTQLRCDDDTAEAKYVAEKILDGVQNGGKYSDNAVLYRTNSQSNNFERTFVKSGIPYRIIGGHRFADRAEVKDIIAYLCVIDNPNDEVRLKRIINQPKRAIGDSSVAAALEISKTLGQSLFDTIVNANEYIPLKRAAGAMTEFASLINGLRAFSINTSDLGELCREVIDKTGYMKYLESLGEEGLSRIDNIVELVNAMAKFSEENEDATLSDYLEEFSLISDIDNYDADADTVVLMTIHSAKGLEFKNVYLVGMDEGIFPSAMSAGITSEIEEERRLAYVGVTRARKKLFLTSCQTRMVYGKTQRNPISRFAKEIPDDYKEIINNVTVDNSSWLDSSEPFGSYKSYDSGYLGSFSSSFSQNSTPSFSGGASFGISSQKPKSKEAVSSLDYKVGDCVNHRVFGNGLVISMTAMANDTLVEVSFDRVGTKKIMANFAKLKKI